MKKLIILGASNLQLPAIQKAKAMDIEVIAVDINPNAIGFKENDIITEIVSTIDTEKVLEIARKYKVDGIMTLATDMPMRTVARVSTKMGLPGISEETALNATNKVCMRQVLKEKNVPIPKFYRVRTIEDFLRAIQNFQEKQEKCIIKPVDSSGSRGIYLLSDLTDRERIIKVFSYSRKYSSNGEVLVEEYMDGPEVSVETLTYDGICHVIQITDKLTTGAPYFVEMGHNEPSILGSELIQEISKIAVNAANAIGIEIGPAHIEIKVTEEGPKIVELGARLGGDNITSHLVPLSTGIDMIESCINLSLGNKPIINKRINKGSAIRYFKSSTGIIKEINGVENAKEIDGIIQICFQKKPGDCINKIMSSGDRIGFIIAQNDTAQKAIYTCEKAMSCIQIIMGEEY